jgi:hypothetical protein
MFRLASATQQLHNSDPAIVLHWNISLQSVEFQSSVASGEHERWLNTQDGFELSSGANAYALDWRYGGNSSA